jgi:hypothetical protein
MQPRLPVMVLAARSARISHFRCGRSCAGTRARIEITLETQREEVYLTLDEPGRHHHGYGETASVTRDGRSVRLMRLSGRTYLRRPARASCTGVT